MKAIIVALAAALVSVPALAQNGPYGAFMDGFNQRGRAIQQQNLEQTCNALCSARHPDCWKCLSASAAGAQRQYEIDAARRASAERAEITRRLEDIYQCQTTGYCPPRF